VVFRYLFFAPSGPLVMLLADLRMIWPIAQLQSRLRRWSLGRQLGVEIPSDVYIAPTAQLQLSPDGRSYGGTIRIGRGVRISDGAILAPYGGNIVIEDGVYIGPYCVLYGHGGLRIGRDTMVGAHSVIIPSNHCFDDPGLPINQQGEISRGIKIGDGAWIGCGVRILDGVNIGDRCVIGAGAVVSRSIYTRSIAVGVPARVIGVGGAKVSSGVLS
jgi:acetyltransferase-like isoleucine patch superfamily enzyme